MLIIFDQKNAVILTLGKAKTVITVLANGRNRRSFYPALDNEFTIVGSSYYWSCYVTRKWLTASNTILHDDVFRHALLREMVWPTAKN